METASPRTHKPIIVNESLHIVCERLVKYPHIQCLLYIRRFFFCLVYLIYIFKCMFIAYSQNVCGIITAYLFCCFESCSLNIPRLLTQSIRRRSNLHVKSEHLANIPRILVSHIRVCLPNNGRVFASCSQKLFAAVHFFRKVNMIYL